MDPDIHTSVDVCDAISINESEVLVVYRENQGKVSRNIIKGPVLHVPAADEW